MRRLAVEFIVVPLALVALLALSVGGCGSDDAATDATSSGAPALESTTDSAAPTEGTVETTTTTTEGDATAPESLGDAADQIREAVPEDQRDELYQQCIDRADSEAAESACETLLGE